MAIALTRPAVRPIQFRAPAFATTFAGVLAAFAGSYTDAEALSRELESVPPTRQRELALRWFARHARTV